MVRPIETAEESLGRSEVAPVGGGVERTIDGLEEAHVDDLHDGQQAENHSDHAGTIRRARRGSTSTIATRTSASIGMRTNAPELNRLISFGPTRANHTSRNAKTVVSQPATVRARRRPLLASVAVSPGRGSSGATAVSLSSLSRAVTKPSADTFTEAGHRSSPVDRCRVSGAPAVWASATGVCVASGRKREKSATGYPTYLDPPPHTSKEPGRGPSCAQSTAAFRYIRDYIRDHNPAGSPSVANVGQDRAQPSDGDMTGPRRNGIAVVDGGEPIGAIDHGARVVRLHPQIVSCRPDDHRSPSGSTWHLDPSHRICHVRIVRVNAGDHLRRTAAGHRRKRCTFGHLLRAQPHPFRAERGPGRAGPGWERRRP